MNVATLAVNILFDLYVQWLLGLPTSRMTQIRVHLAAWISRNLFKVVQSTIPPF